jgi:hypothetical protein
LLVRGHHTEAGDLDALGSRAVTQVNGDGGGSGGGISSRLVGGIEGRHQ